MGGTASASVLAASLSGWRPGTATMSRRVDPWPAAAFAALLGTPEPPLEVGTPLPPMWHWFTLLDHVPQSAIGVDGHPVEGPLLPPIPRRRRMFAGGRLRVDGPIPVGAELSRRSTVVDVAVKSGRSGEMAFVTVRHELAVAGAAVGVEEQDLVYRAAPDEPGPRTAPRPEDGAPEPPGPWRGELAVDPVLLFRFSALTYNAHRIHYDRPYAIGVEGYPDLVVHGPLLALLALELPRAHVPDRVVASFRYRLLRPAFLPARLVSAGGPGQRSAEVTVGVHGRLPSLTGTVGFQ